jgi:hypothetical protein
LPPPGPSPEGTPDRLLIRAFAATMAVYVGGVDYGHGRSVLEDNDLTGNMEGAWVIEEDSGTDVTRAHEGITYGLFRAPVLCPFTGDSWVVSLLIESGSWALASEDRIG